MSRILTLEISDEIYTLLQRQVQAIGTSPTEVSPPVANKRSVASKRQSRRFIPNNRPSK